MSASSSARRTVAILPPRGGSDAAGRRRPRACVTRDLGDSRRWSALSVIVTSLKVRYHWLGRAPQVQRHRDRFNLSGGCVGQGRAATTAGAGDGGGRRAKGLGG